MIPMKDEDDVLHDEVARADDEGRQHGQLGAEVAEDRGEDGDDLPEEENGDDDGEDADGHWIDHGLLDLAPQPDGLLDELGQPADTMSSDPDCSPEAMRLQ